MSSRLQTASALMIAFAERTGVSAPHPPRRYLWTDAFAVCNFLGLARAAKDGRHLELALALVDQVHHVLGRHAKGAAREGWLSGLGDVEGERHPTRGGLRIGKPLPERGADERYDPRVEWDRDGQYFHYLTRWMHALDQVARHTGQHQFRDWARELADVAHDAFVEPGGRHMAWKKSVDLSRTLVPSMGHHDPLDGWLTARQVGADRAAQGFERLMRGRDWSTSDALGLGGLMIDALRAEQLVPGSPLVDELIDAASRGLRDLFASGELEASVSRRLAFRELGLSIGLRAVELLIARRRRTASTSLRRIASQGGLAEDLETLWSRPDLRKSPLWLEHQDINEVMLATSLQPEGYLLLT